MRQRTTNVAIAAVAAVLIVALVAFAVLRSRHVGDHMHEHDEHMAEPAWDHVEEHEHETAAEETEGPVLSGEMVEGVRVVGIVARQYEFEPSTITVRQGEKIRLKVTSEDVTHGIDIEGYNIDRVLKPNKTEVIEFTADKPGRHHFHCSVYCGKGHEDMHGELVVLERRD